MVSDYKNADGDYRGVLERYLPTAYKTIGNGSDVHMGLLGALKQMLVTTEQDIIDGTQQMFLANANSWALDLYGDWVGESRKGELDDTYRARIIEKITLGRNTVGNIIVGIKREVNDPDLTVSVYEPWRNIFILNKSFLNGADRLIGKFYRYAVVQVTLNKYVNALELQVIADKYKSAGVSLVFVYREGIVAGDGALLALPLKLITENRNTITRNRSQLQGTLLMNGLPTGTKATDLFTVNESDLNGADVLASDPNSVYRGVYGTVPSKNIFGTTAPTAGMTSDPYDFIFQQSKVDTSTLGGRNYVLNSSGENASAGNWPNVQGGRVAFSSVNVYYGSTDIGLSYTGTGTQEWYYALVESYANASDGPLVIGNTYSFSVDVKGTVPSAAFRISDVYTPSVAVNNTSWTRLIYTGVLPAAGGTGKYYIRLNAMKGNTNGSFTKGQSLRFRHFKIESGTLPTDWTPAPEDTPKIYVNPYTGTDYTALNRLDGVTETVTTSGLPTVAFNISEYVKGVLQAKALNDSNRYGRNLLLGTRNWVGDSTRWNKRGTVTDNSGTYRGMIVASTHAAWKSPTYMMQNAGILQVGKTYTFSTYVRNTSDTDTKVAPYYEKGIVTPIGNTTLLPAHTDWFRVSITFQCVKDPTTSTSGLRWEGANALTNGPIQFAGYKLEEGNVPTPWAPAPEDNSTAVDYTNFSTPVSSININLKGSPFGLAPTTITVLSQGATPLTGKWYKNGTLISPQTTQVSDVTTPTGTWSFKLDTPTLVSSVTLTDNYPDATGAYRVITMTTTDNRELVILNTTQQVTGTINTLRLQTQTPEIYRPYIKSATIGNTTLSSPQVFDASTGNWVAITKSTNLVPYIAYGDVTNALYVTLRNKTTQQNIDYLGLDITQVSVEGQ